MAFNSSVDVNALSQDLQDAEDRDAPIFLASVLRTSVDTSYETRWNSAGAVNGANSTKTTPYDSWAAFDGRMSTYTEANLTTTTHYYCAHIASSTVDAILVDYTDSTGAYNHDLVIQVAADAGFTSDVTTVLASTSIGANGRKAFLSLGAAGNRRFTNVEYLRFGFSPTAGGSYTDSNRPRIRQLLIGQRTQLSRKFNAAGFDEAIRRSEVWEAAGTMHQMRRTLNQANARDLRGTYEPGSGDGLYTSFDDVAAIRALHAACSYGRDPVGYIEDPATTPNDWRLLFWDGPGLTLPRASANRRTWDASFTEQGYRYQEDV